MSTTDDVTGTVVGMRPVFRAPDQQLSTVLDVVESGTGRPYECRVDSAAVRAKLRLDAVCTFSLVRSGKRRRGEVVYAKVADAQVLRPATDDPLMPGGDLRQPLTPGARVPQLVLLIKSCTPLQTVRTRHGRDAQLCRLDAVDEHNNCAQLTLWRDHAVWFSREEALPCVAVCRQFVVAEPRRGQGTTTKCVELGSCTQSTLVTNPMYLKAARLLKIAALRTGAFGKAAAERADVRAVCDVMDVHSSRVSYPACKTCRKKVFDQGNGEFFCEKCGTFSSDIARRLLLRVHFSGLGVLTLFHDTARVLLGWSEEEVGRRLEQLDDLLETDPEERWRIFERLRYARRYVVHANAVDRRVTGLVPEKTPARRCEELLVQIRALLPEEA